MKLKHPNIESPLFKLIGVHELDIVFEDAGEDGDSFSLRIELFQSQSDSGLYRYRAYRTDHYRLKPTFPLEIEKDILADEMLFVRFGAPHLPEIDDFHASSPEDAFKEILDRLNKSMKHITGKEIEFE